MILNQNKINIFYEDDLILIVDKPPKMLSHPDKLHKEPDLLSALKHPEYAVITRLDFNTSGLVLLGKSQKSISILNQLSRNNEIHKIYQCLVLNYFQNPEAILTAYLLKDEINSVVRLSDKKIENGQKIITSYKVLTEKNNCSLLEVELITGKTHQIRAHMAFAEHPLIGDPLYGQKSLNKKYNLHFQALVSTKIWFTIQDSTNPLFYLNKLLFEKKDTNLMALIDKR
ncbi:MAG: RluA family pseudouridine synthase [Firmicutes bacterium]|nr:RluA family pseudouridine synthase [Bacillota bacterium]